MVGAESASLSLSPGFQHKARCVAEAPGVFAELIIDSKTTTGWAFPIQVDAPTSGQPEVSRSKKEMGFIFIN